MSGCKVSGQSAIVPEAGRQREPAGSRAGPCRGRRVSQKGYFLSVGVTPGKGKAPNMALDWLCICSCICMNRLFDWSM